jgi:hypothetical protein
MMQKSKSITILTAMFCCTLLNAQHKFSATLQPVHEDGYYQIRITPDLTSYLKADLSDLRLVDKENKQVPFIIDNPKGSYSGISSRTLPIQSIRNNEGKTEIIIENSGSYRISNLVIGLKNAEARRNASLSGSDNNKDWFAIIDSFFYNVQSANQWKFGFFPTSYAYFKLIIQNGENAPLNIQKIETVADSVVNAEFPISIINPRLELSQEEEGSKSLISVRSDRPFHFNGIKLHIESSTPYKRDIQVYGGELPSYSEINAVLKPRVFTISSDDTAALELPLQKAKMLLIVIENGDNPPLKVTSIETMQPNRSIVAFLKKGHDYFLLMDDWEAKKPHYDLDEFRERIPRGNLLTVKEINPLPVEAKNEKTEFLSKRWVWPVLITVIGVLALLAWKLTREIKKEN